MEEVERCLHASSTALVYAAWWEGGGTYGTASISYAPCQATAFDFAGRRVGLAGCDFWFTRDECDELDLGVFGTESGFGEGTVRVVWEVFGVGGEHLGGGDEV